jgi:hypothetical protein
MANERQKRLMQEALDEQLEGDARQRLFRELDENADSSAEFQRLRSVDRLLQTAPFERAPKTLALSVMARLAETLKQPGLSQLSGLALAIALSIMTVVMIPLLIGISTLFLSAIGSASALTGLLQVVGKMLALVIAGLDTLVESAQGLLATYPQTPALMLTLVPVLVFWVARLNTRDPSDPDGPKQ